MCFIISSVAIFILLILLIKNSIGFPVNNGTISQIYAEYCIRTYVPIAYDIVASPEFSMEEL